MAGTADDLIWSSAQGLQGQLFEQVYHFKVLILFGAVLLILVHHRLLESGKLSGAQLCCGKRTWKVHKAILCARSEWFRRKITGPFKVRAHIHIAQQDMLLTT